MNIPGLPPKQGLYDPEHEKDGSVIAFVGNITIVKQESPEHHRGLPR
jgi:hypothetical protein